MQYLATFAARWFSTNNLNRLLQYTFTSHWDRTWELSNGCLGNKQLSQRLRIGSSCSSCVGCKIAWCPISNAQPWWTSLCSVNSSNDKCGWFGWNNNIKDIPIFLSEPSNINNSQSACRCKPCKQSIEFNKGLIASSESALQKGISKATILGFAELFIPSSDLDRYVAFC